MEQSKPAILEPIIEVQVEVTDEFVGDVVGDLNTRRGRMQGMEPSAPGKTTVRALVPMAELRSYALDLRSITRGRGRFRQSYSHYEEVPHHVQQQLVAQHEKERAEHEAAH